MSNLYRNIQQNGGGKNTEHVIKQSEFKNNTTIIIIQIKIITITTQRTYRTKKNHL